MQVNENNTTAQKHIQQMFEMSSYCGQRSGPMISDVSRLNMLLHNEPWHIVYINALSATIALALTLSWFQMSTKTKLVSNDHHVSFRKL